MSGEAPFLEIVTRTFPQRSRMLARNRASLAGLTDKDWVQTLLVDTVGRGCIWANCNLANLAPTGQWLWILDDDDVCCLPNLIEELRGATARRKPGIVMVRVQHERFGRLPSDANWGERPIMGQIGYSNFLVRADVWEKHRARAFSADKYAGDYSAIDYLWSQKLVFHWLDVLAAYYPQRSIGAAE